MQCLLLLLNALSLASGSAALTLYTNSSRLAVSTSTTISTQVPVNDYILRGLGVGATTTLESSTPGLQRESISSATSKRSSSPSIRATNASYYTASWTSEYPLYNNVFTATPNVSTASQAMSQAMQCWSDIATWRHQSASFWNASVANRAWFIASSYSSTATNWSRTATIYPSSVSTYRLCDGTPRANVRPTTTILTGTSTLWGSFTTTLTPTFPAQPCELRPSDCRILYDDTNIVAINDIELLRQCGSPAHRVGDAQCLLGGGPVEIIYFPVSRNETNLCQGNNSTISAGPLVPGLSKISTLGHTFTSASVYISFKTLFATYDGFWDTVGPTFTDYIVPLHSTDISTQCGGWGAAYGHGTALNYADLNWPVPASAYSCQDRCTTSSSSSAVLKDGTVLWELYDFPADPRCSTIWSDINPIVALPTKIRDMVPEWSTCSFYNDYLANFWFDPPIALQPQAAVAEPTLPSTITPQSTSAAPASVLSSRLPENTQAVSVTILQLSSTVASTVAAEATASSTSDTRPESHPGDQPLLFTVVGAAVETKTTSGPFKTTRVPDGVNTAASASEDVATPTIAIPQSSVEGIPSVVSFEYDPTDTKALSTGEHVPAQASSNPIVATAAGLSVLQQALSSSKYIDPTRIVSPDVASPSIPSGTLTTLADSQIAAMQTGNLSGLDPTTSAVEDASTISGTHLSIYSGGLVVDESTLAASVGRTPTATSTAYVIAAGSFTLSAISVEHDPEAVQIGTATLSLGGPVITVSGQVLSKASSGVMLMPHKTKGSEGVALPSVIIEKPAEAVVMAAGGHTVTAVILTGNYTAISVGGTTLSKGGPAALIQGATFTVAEGGLGIIRPPNSTTTRLPSVNLKSTSTRSIWSSTASTLPTSTSEGSKVRDLGWAGLVLLLTSTLMCLPCIYT